MSRRPLAALESPGVRAAIVVVLLAIVVLSLAVPLRSWLRQNDENAALAAEVDQRQQRITELEEELRRWEDDGYVEKQARERLHWVYPGETSYIVTDGSERESKDLPKPTGTSASWYERLWQSYTESAEQSQRP